MRKSFILLCSLLCGLLWTNPALAAGARMRAHQPAYGFEFDVYRTADMPANWWKTYDGFWVTRRLDTNWVYGRPAADGPVLTDILVGSGDPRSMPELGGSPTPPTSRAAAPISARRGPLPAYTPPEPRPMPSSRIPRRSGWVKSKDPRYLKELENIVKGLRVIVDNFKKVHVYWYPYLTRHHFGTAVPLDFYIVHQRETGHVEFFVEVGVWGSLSPDEILFNFDGYDGEVYTLVPLPFELEHSLFARRWIFSKSVYRGYGLRLASNSRSGALPSPSYSTLFRKISEAKKVEIRLNDKKRIRETEADWYPEEGEALNTRDTSYRKRGFIFVIDEKNRFAKSMEARYETYRKIVELEERWQDSPDDSEPIPAPMPQGLDASLIYDIAEARDFELLRSRLTSRFGEPETEEVPNAGNTRLATRVTWRTGAGDSVVLSYLFEGGSWNANKWEWLGSRVVEGCADATFEARLDEFTAMLGAPKVKKASEATWLIGDVNFTILQENGSVVYTSKKELLNRTVIDTIR